MWKKLKRTVKDVIKIFKDRSKDDQMVDTNPEECLQRLETSLNSPNVDEFQMQVNGQWISKYLMESISADSCQQKLLKLCRQTEINRLDTIFPNHIKTLGTVLWSGCYSEVLRINNKNGHDIVLKVSLINRLDKDGIPVQTASAILSDITNSKRLSDLKAIPIEISENYCENFANIKSFHYLWSDSMIFNKSEYKGKARNHRHEYLISHQIFGGKHLDSRVTLAPNTALSLVKQLIASLGVAEEALSFEHRDLHLSNLLIRRSDTKYYKYSINGRQFKVELCGYKLAIIDTTFSRTQINVGIDDDKQKVTYFYNDLSTLNLEDYPNAELKKVYLKQNQITGNKWKKFWPQTNIIWLTYSVNRICKMTDKWIQKYPNSSHSNHMSELNRIKLTIPDSHSAKDLVYQCLLD